MSSVIESFHYPEAIKLNVARVKHLETLGLNFKNKNVLETGCGGRGDVTNFLIKNNANVTLNDYRIENIKYLLNYLNVNLPHNTWNLNEEIKSDTVFDIIVCYGTLYHLTKPDQAIKNLSKICKEFLIISTCTNGKNDTSLNVLYEGNTPTQGCDGNGCRPGRQYIYNELLKNFKYVYIPKTQPDNIDFPLKFPSNNHASRNIFIGSHIELNNDLFVNYLPNEYLIHV